MIRTFRQLMGELVGCLRASRFLWNLFRCLFDGDDATTTKLQKEKVLIKCISSLCLTFPCSPCLCLYLPTLLGCLCPHTIFLRGCTSVRRYNLTIKNGKGCHLFTTDGKDYLDCVSGIATCALGHANKELSDAITNQMNTVHHVSNLYYIPQQAALANWLCENSNADKAFFCNSGAEANEAAIKCARRHAANKGATVSISYDVSKIYILLNSLSLTHIHLTENDFTTETCDCHRRTILSRSFSCRPDSNCPTKIPQGIRI